MLNLYIYIFYLQLKQYITSMAFSVIFLAAAVALLGGVNAG